MLINFTDILESRPIQEGHLHIIHGYGAKSTQIEIVDNSRASVCNSHTRIDNFQDVFGRTQKDRSNGKRL